MTASNKAMVENLDSQIAFLRREVLELRANGGIDTTGQLLPRSELVTTLLTQLIALGSKSRSETWSNVKNANPNRMSLPLAACPVLPDYQTFAIDHLVAATYPTEKDMYRPFISAVGAILNSVRTADTLGATVIDTHNRQYLGVYSPDITLAIGGLRHPDSASVYMVIELKHTNVTLEGKGLGQAYDYSLAIRAAQGHRRFHVVMLSNFIDTHFVLLDTKDASTRHFIASSLSHAISYIKHRVLHSTDFSPSVPTYSLCLGDMVRRLGTSKHSVVSEFDAPDGTPGTLSRLFIDEKLGTTMAVKRSSDISKAGDIAHEISMLTKIKKCSGTSTIARLVYSSPQNDELGIMPVGSRIDPTELSEHTAITILTDVLAALTWLHSKNILHRDVRIDNVVLHEGRARLIDFGAAIELPAVPDTPYWGGYLCCPQELIGDFSRPYTPAKKHDLLAYVMMAALMAFPHTMKSMSSKHVSQHTPESYRLIRFWARLRSSSVWRPYVKAAEKGEYGGLRSVGDVFAVL